MPEAFGSPPAADPMPSPDEPPARADETPRARLDRLFTELSREPDAEKAKAIAGRIEAEWRKSGSATVDLLMQWAARAMGHKQTAAAYDMIDSALVLAPDYAEAWNRRATLNFATDQWGKSLADIEQTLSREPRHFGALVGLGLILERMGRKERALEAYARALSVYPTLKSAQDAVARLSDELLGPTL
ncbi:hypothetical protein ASG48_04190 [Aurantimonas sp. Leaf443]|nr:hypothetical protein ASG48_04190 [Aurantimonas sp. Leaf443]